jgi:hypothetical protein
MAAAHPIPDTPAGWTSGQSPRRSLEAIEISRQTAT